MHIWKYHQVHTVPLCGNLPSAAQTFGNTVSCKYIIGYRQLKTLGDAVSWKHWRYHQLLTFGIPSAAYCTFLTMPSNDQIPLHTPENVLKISEKYEVSSYPWIMIYRGAEFHLFWSRLSTVCVQYAQTPLILRQCGGKETMNIWATALGKTRGKVSHTQYEQDVWVRLASCHTCWEN